MSDDVRCDQCSKPGRRPRMHPAPPDWFFLESTVPSEIEGEPDDTVIVLACSAACRDAIWRIGPGPRWTYAEVEKGAAKVSLHEAVCGRLGLPLCSSVDEVLRELGKWKRAEADNG